MACPDLEKIEQLLNDDLPRDERSEIETHLRTCPACSNRLSDLSENEKLLRDIEHVLPSGADKCLETAAVPTSIGHYTIVRELGRGGMGVVYEAKQESPRRSVALKVIRGGGRLDEHRAASLRREAQALARLKHPGIATIHEAGQTEDGEHYFALELVDGTPLNDFARAKALGLRDRLDLFRRVCDAVAYAHQRGVIHRDIKPSNILVDANGQPKLLDFGLARITDSDVTMTTVVTETGKIQGTLPYMSPEQTRGNPDDIDLRSDVYSLGVVLYELLTNQLPYTVDRVLLPEAVRMICEEEPRKPSTINRTLRGDLETIALKALEKDADRRYQSVEALRGDIRRYLSKEPILARPPSATYQFRKLVARHKLPFAFTAVLFALVTGFGIWMTLSYREAESLRLAERDQRRMAEANLTRALDAEQDASTEAERARTEAETATRVKDFMVQLFASATPQVARGKEISARELLDRGAKQIADELGGEPIIQASLMEAIGDVYRELDVLDEAERLLEQALAIRREVQGDGHIDTIICMHYLGLVYRQSGKPAEAESVHRESLVLATDTLGPEHEETLAAMCNLGAALNMQNKWDEAEPLFRKTIELSDKALGEDDIISWTARSGLASLLMKQSRVHESLPIRKELLERLRRIEGDDHPDTLGQMNGVAMNYLSLGRPREAAAMFRTALEGFRRIVGEEHRSTLTLSNNLAFSLQQLGELDEAEELYRSNLDVQKRVFPNRKGGYLLTMSNLAGVLCDLGKYDEAEALALAALTGRIELSGENHLLTCQAMATRDWITYKHGRLGEAEELMRKTIEIKRKHLGDKHQATVESMSQLAMVLTERGRLDEAERLFAETLQLAGESHGEGHYKISGLNTYYAKCLALQGKREEAGTILRKAHAELSEKLGAEHRVTREARKMMEELRLAASTP
ncbi:MAG: serine/threonine-protein kinase [Phycisphaerae bacterium]